MRRIVTSLLSLALAVSLLGGSGLAGQCDRTQTVGEQRKALSACHLTGSQIPCCCDDSVAASCACRSSSRLPLGPIPAFESNGLSNLQSSAVLSASAASLLLLPTADSPAARTGNPGFGLGRAHSLLCVWRL